ncbi:molybdate ABC transporter substrate-binding protein [Mergibacter septicus]|uniref:Molybdate ABC transporter substrate-binding protein n=1 Tax=Mergibacter septicus TaxID=221402 RepID=A0A8E3SA19_9PAST|nr:molybdate ABC transporter substrate-binding protein [Mergibacter septicus]AWX15570.1 molybdate ABC transporter substrate-binding protein [Mergibacter septicus]QDJ13045.1 molybdate ABC transporter substrate-binding protein [Mergibacter septicus]QDJ14824.1 molybdate ABC transporter substrate-binding protein [Mergibacter septicus]UTU47748.1 molybdate ABC transporter substrate-binding protein [Mergibacter septicus]WMR96646.1 molybdate ABC transporter substrate-binding protein [Mergibacter septi
MNLKPQVTFKIGLIALSLGLITTSVCAAEITVFAAASMTNAMQKVADEYSQRYPQDKIVFSFASSSTLAKQIEQGAPADIYVSANTKWMTYLNQKGLTVQDSEKVLVGNSLVMIAPNNSQITQFEVDSGDWFKYLENSYLAVGDPNHVPAGQYMKAAMQKLAFWDKLEPKLARGKDVRAALALVERGEAPLGVVYSTDAKQSNKVKVVAEFPLDSYPAIEYPATIIKGHDTQAVQNFYTYLQSDTAKKIYQSFGFNVQ